MWDDNVTVFWLIHLFLGIVFPILVYTGCCGLDKVTRPKETESVVEVHEE